jgi:hypothetical protein
MRTQTQKYSFIIWLQQHSYCTDTPCFINLLHVSIFRPSSVINTIYIYCLMMAETCSKFIANGKSVQIIVLTRPYNKLVAQYDAVIQYF